MSRGKFKSVCDKITEKKRNQKNYWQCVFGELENKVKTDDYRSEKYELSKVATGRLYDVLSHVIFKNNDGSDKNCTTVEQDNTNELKGQETFYDIATFYMKWKTRDQKVDQAHDDEFKTTVAKNPSQGEHLDEIRVEVGENGLDDKNNIGTKKKEDASSKKSTQDMFCVYNNFFGKKPQEVAIWRPKEPKKFYEMTLNEKSQHVTEQIAEEFIEWMKTLNESENPSLTTKDILTMFDVGNATIKTPIEVNQTDLSSLRKMYTSNNRVKAKIRMSKSKYVNSSNKAKEEDWIQNRKELISMEKIWRGITNLRSTKGFVEHMKTKPEVVPPEYLASRMLITTI